MSAADMEAEDAIIATIRGAFPEHAILGEESGHIDGAREGSGYKWLVDPIDGTANFVHGFPYYAVSIALVHGTEITHAVVLDPVHDELFTAVEGQGRDLQRRARCTCPRASRSIDALVGTVLPARESPSSRGYLPDVQRADRAMRRACARRDRARSSSRTSPPGGSTASG